jgi:hypothetical protein
MNDVDWLKKELLDARAERDTARTELAAERERGYQLSLLVNQYAAEPRPEFLEALNQERNDAQRNAAKLSAELAAERENHAKWMAIFKAKHDALGKCRIELAAELERREKCAKLLRLSAEDRTEAVNTLAAERERRMKAESAVIGAMAERDNAQRLVQGGYSAPPGHSSSQVAKLREVLERAQAAGLDDIYGELSAAIDAALDETKGGE